MKITTLRVYEGNNIKKVRRIIEISIENTCSIEIRKYLKGYFRVSFLLGYKEKLIDIATEGGAWMLWVTYTEEELSRYIISNLVYSLDNCEILLSKAENLIKRDFLYYVVKAAREKEIPVIELSEDVFQLGYCKNSIILGRTFQSYENSIIVEFPRNRKTLWQKLRYSEIPKTNGKVLYSIEEIKDISNFKYPINIRSVDKNNEVKITINNEIELNRVLDNVMKMYTRAFIYSGEVKYRIICYKGEVKVVLKKENGYKLLEIENSSLEILEVAEALKSLKKFCRTIYENIPIEFMYIDLQEEAGFKVVDLGAVFDVGDELKEVKDKIIDRYIDALVEDGIGLIPIISITGTNGKTTTARLIYHILNKLGFKAALTSTGGIFISGKKIRNGDTTGFLSARAVLSNKEVEVAVMETARGGILRNGLGYEKASVAVFTSISEDHIGMSGIKDLNDLMMVKSTVLEELARNGKVVVKAQKELAEYVKLKSNICLYDIEKNQHLQEHIEKGGEAFYLKDSFLIYSKDNIESKLINIKELPFTHGGRSKGNILNIMASIAAVSQVYTDFNNILEAIKVISCDLFFNPGRQNVLDVENFKVILDYGHNSEAFNEVLTMAKALETSKLTAIITAPGDRMNKYIRELGSIAASYCDNIIIREQADLRGRNPGETAALLKAGALAAGFKEEAIKYINKEEEALLTAMENSIQGEVIVLFTQCLDVIIPVINNYLRKKGKAPVGEGLDFSH